MTAPPAMRNSSRIAMNNMKSGQAIRMATKEAQDDNVSCAYSSPWCGGVCTVRLVVPSRYAFLTLCRSQTVVTRRGRRNACLGDIPTLCYQIHVPPSSPISSCHPFFAHVCARCHFSCQGTSATIRGTGGVLDSSSIDGDGVSNDSETCHRLALRCW